MRSFGCLRLLVIFALAYSSAAQTFPTDVAARFALPCQGVPGVYDPTPGNQCVQYPSTQQNSYLTSSITITWGSGINPAYTSALQFDPYSGVNLGLGPSGAQVLGKLTHFNYPINCYSNCAQYIPTLFNWDLSLTLHVGATPIYYTASYVMNVDETPNVDGGRNGAGQCLEGEGDPSWLTYNPPNGVDTKIGNQLPPCCPYYTQPPTPNPDPNGAFSSIDGACSDKISFVSDTVPSGWVVSGTTYTLVILGISNSSTTPPGSGNTLLYFISQEYQQQVGYIWAYVARACNSSQGCNDNNPCTNDTCSAGLCSHKPLTGQQCTFQGQTSNHCINYACNAAGTCSGTAINSGQSCSFPSPASPVAPQTSECTASVCSNGGCSWQPVSGNPTCTTTTPHEPQCYKPQCSAGTCGLVSTGLTNGACTLQNSVQSQAVNSLPTCNKGTCTALSVTSGTCQLKISSGSCGAVTGLSTQYCNKRVCQSTTRSGVTVGTCGYSYQSGSCGAALTQTDCKARTCQRKASNTQLGSCSYTANSQQGSCSYSGAVVVKSCKLRTCNSLGSCTYSNNDPQGSCSQSASGVATAIKFCNVRKCSSGSCIYSYDTHQNTLASGSCTSSYSYKECWRRVCHSTTNTQVPGSCGYSYNNNQGSCVGVSTAQCNQRICHNGVCDYSYQAWGGLSGSCQSFSYQPCNARVCKNKFNGVTYSTSALGSCGYSPMNSGSCTNINPDATLCNIRQCSNGACALTQNPVTQGGSCSQSNTIAWKECNVRVCKSHSGVGSCGYSASYGGGSCVGSYSTSILFAAPFFPGCAARKCSSGACQISVNVGGTCNTHSFSTNDYACWKQQCKSVTANGITAGSCGINYQNGASCTAYPTRPCSTPTCNATGYCYQNVANYPSTRSCTDATKGVTGSFCNPQFCDGAGSCRNEPTLREGSSCITPPDGNAAQCINSACRSGTCLDLSNLAYNNSVQCANAAPGSNPCIGYYCHFKSNSKYNHQGTCIAEVNTQLVGTTCTLNPNTDSPENQACYDLRCNASGDCQKFFHADGSYCGTPSNAQLSNGYGCSQFVCHSGTCNTLNEVPIPDGSQCAGVQPCDPAAPGCLIECQKFVCQTGVCTLKDYREGQNCTFIKFESARDGSLVPRDSESGSYASNDCSQGVCTKGLCLAVNAQNGTSCGNRTQYSDLCYGDYCNSQGQCVFTPRRNCLGVVPLPSVCWDAYCEAATGDCSLVPNGVVDCSCIDDCTACTAPYDGVNRNSTTARTLSCYWCTGNSQTGFPPGCYNRMLPGSNIVLPPPTRVGSCYADSSPCGGGSGLSGGQAAGIVLGTVGLASLASLLVALGVLLVRYFTAAGVPPANASLTDLAFDKNVKNNVFYEGASLSQYSAMYAEPKFITT